MRAIRGTFRHALYHEKLINYDKISDESEHFQTRPTPLCVPLCYTHWVKHQGAVVAVLFGSVGQSGFERVTKQILNILFYYKFTFYIWRMNEKHCSF